MVRCWLAGSSASWWFVKLERALSLKKPRDGMIKAKITISRCKIVGSRVESSINVIHIYSPNGAWCRDSNIGPTCKTASGKPLHSAIMLTKEMPAVSRSESPANKHSATTRSIKAWKISPALVVFFRICLPSQRLTPQEAQSRIAFRGGRTPQKRIMAM